MTASVYHKSIRRCERACSAMATSTDTTGALHLLQICDVRMPPRNNLRSKPSRQSFDQRKVPPESLPTREDSSPAAGWPEVDGVDAGRRDLEASPEVQIEHG